MYGFKTLGWLGKPHAGLFLWVCQICGTCAIGLFQAERDNTLRSSHHRAAVLVAIAIPVFTTQLKKAELATDTANVRAAYAEVVATALADNTLDDNGKITVTIPASTATKCELTGGGDYGAALELTHKKDSTVKGTIPVDKNTKVEIG